MLLLLRVLKIPYTCFVVVLLKGFIHFTIIVVCTFRFSSTHSRIRHISICCLLPRTRLQNFFQISQMLTQESKQEVRKGKEKKKGKNHDNSLIQNLTFQTFFISIYFQFMYFTFSPFPQHTNEYSHNDNGCLRLAILSRRNKKRKFEISIETRRSRLGVFSVFYDA